MHVFIESNCSTVRKWWNWYDLTFVDLHMYECVYVFLVSGQWLQPSLPDTSVVKQADSSKNIRPKQVSLLQVRQLLAHFARSSYLWSQGRAETYFGQDRFLADGARQYSPKDNQGPCDVAPASLSYQRQFLPEPAKHHRIIHNASEECTQKISFDNCNCFLAQELPTRQESVSVLMQDKNLDQELKAGTVSIFEKVMFIVYAMQTALRQSHLEEGIRYPEMYRLRGHSHRVMVQGKLQRMETQKRAALDAGARVKRLEWRVWSFNIMRNATRCNTFLFARIQRSPTKILAAMKSHKFTGLQHCRFTHICSEHMQCHSLSYLVTRRST